MGSNSAAVRRSDLVLAMGLTLLSQLELWFMQDIAGTRLAVILAAFFMTAALAWRRRQPLATLSLITAAFLVQEVFSGALSDMIIPFVTLMVAIYSATAFGSAKGRISAGALGIGTTSISVAFDEGGADASSLIYALVVSLAAWGAGMMVWQRDRRVTELQAETVNLAQQRDEAARRAVEEERSRVARELHDIIAHSVSVMRIQAAAAEEVFDDKPERAREALRSIQVVGRQALTDMRQLLVLLRGNDGDDPLEPQPSIADLAGLVEQAQSAGLPVALSVEGKERPLPAVLELCVYRIVQESLTNALKHAGPANVRVVLEYCDREIRVEVRDSGRGPQHRNGGHGLIGMSERVALFGGRFEAGADDEGGFAVRADLPIEADVQ